MLIAQALAHTVNWVFIGLFLSHSGAFSRAEDDSNRVKLIRIVRAYLLRRFSYVAKFRPSIDIVK